MYIHEGLDICTLLKKKEKSLMSSSDIKLFSFFFNNVQLLATRDVGWGGVGKLQTSVYDVYPSFGECYRKARLNFGVWEL